MIGRSSEERAERAEATLDVRMLRVPLQLKFHEIEARQAGADAAGA